MIYVLHYLTAFSDLCTISTFNQVTSDINRHDSMSDYSFLNKINSGFVSSKELYCVYGRDRICL